MNIAAAAVVQEEQGSGYATKMMSFANVRTVDAWTVYSPYPRTVGIVGVICHTFRHAYP